MMLRKLFLMVLVWCAAPAGALVTVDFEGAGLAPESYANGADRGGGFTAGPVRLHNSFFDWGGGWTSWAGFALSTVTDNQTPGFFNQYSAWPGSGAGGSAAYAVGYQDDFNAVVPTITLVERGRVVSVDLANTTYAGLAMRDGEPPAQKFGRAAGDYPDWFRVTITGYAGPNATGAVTGTLPVYLADYRGDSASDRVVDNWLTVDLSALGAVGSLTFAVATSDVGAWGMNTPSYFALDNLVLVPTPEPASAALAAWGLGAVGMAVRRRRSRPVRAAERLPH